MMSTDIMVEMSHTCRIKEHIWNTPGYRPRDGEATHQWELQIRDRDADRMAYVEKVVVQLHDTFPNPRRGAAAVLIPRESLNVLFSGFSSHFSAD